MGGEHVATGQLAQDETTALELIVLAQALQRGDHLVQLCLGGLGEHLGADRLAGQEQQCLERAFELWPHQAASIRARCAASASTGVDWRVISPNGSSWVQVSSPCL